MSDALEKLGYFTVGAFTDRQRYGKQFANGEWYTLDIYTNMAIKKRHYIRGCSGETEGIGLTFTEMKAILDIVGGAK